MAKREEESPSLSMKNTQKIDDSHIFVVALIASPPKKVPWKSFVSRLELCRVLAQPISTLCPSCAYIRFTMVVLLEDLCKKGLQFWTKWFLESWINSRCFFCAWQFEISVSNDRIFMVVLFFCISKTVWWHLIVEWSKVLGYLEFHLYLVH